MVFFRYRFMCLSLAPDPSRFRILRSRFAAFWRAMKLMCWVQKRKRKNISALFFLSFFSSVRNSCFFFLVCFFQWFWGFGRVIDKKILFFFVVVFLVMFQKQGSHRVLQGAAQRGAQFCFMFVVLRTLFFHAAKWALSALKLVPPWRDPPEAPLEERKDRVGFWCFFHKCGLLSWLVSDVFLNRVQQTVSGN